MTTLRTFTDLRPVSVGEVTRIIDEGVNSCDQRGSLGRLDVTLMISLTPVGTALTTRLIDEQS